jgi:hypothetical protein
MTWHGMAWQSGCRPSSDPCVSPRKGRSFGVLKGARSYRVGVVSGPDAHAGSADTHS